MTEHEEMDWQNAWKNNYAQSWYNEHQHDLSLNVIKAFAQKLLRLVDADETAMGIAALESYKKPVRKFDARGREIPEQEPEGIVL